MAVLSSQQLSAQSFVLDLQYNPMSFTNAKRTVITNAGNNGYNQGSVHRYDDVVTIDGVTIYAYLTILETNRAFITNFDDDSQTGEKNRFQPRIGSSSSSGGYIVYQLEFFDEADDAPVFLYNYYITCVDIDGNSSSDREFIEVGGYESYLLDQSTRLSVTANQSTGRTRFSGRTTNLDGITFENTAAFIANYSTPNNLITFAMGVTARNNERFFSAQFGDKGGQFTKPVETNNPLPVAIDDVGVPVEGISGGVAVDNVLDNDLYDGDPVDPNDVVISLISAASNPGVVLNSATGEVTVAAGTPAGDYTLVYQICMVNNPSECDLATVYVEVTVPQNITNYYPAAGPGTLAFEDLWPSRGDYDFNDMVIDFQFEINTNGNNYVKNITATFTLKAFGASFHNGFGFQLSDRIDPDDLIADGYRLSGDLVTVTKNGMESGQSKPTIIVFDDAYNIMKHPGTGIGVNTDPSAPYVEPVTITVEITFPVNKYTYNDLDIASFNPFIIVNQKRGREVHLPDYEPTDLADLSLLGTEDDDSNPAIGRYYKRANNLPWAISIYESFDYPIEKAVVTEAHLKFDDWATSGGVQYPDWYQDKPGYRNEALIYRK